MKIKITLLNEKAVLPKKAHASDAGFDLVATSMIETSDFIEYGTGLALEIPEGFCGKIYPRSSISKYQLALCNSVGLIDSSYRGEIKIRFKKSTNNLAFFPEKVYNIGDRVAQLTIEEVLNAEFENVTKEDLSETERSENGFGSTGE